jgi:hypothetical protein
MPRIKYTTVSIQEISAHPTMRLDPGYWIKKKKQQATSRKRQATSLPHSGGTVVTKQKGIHASKI